jgi:hypothetical protein
MKRTVYRFVWKNNAKRLQLFGRRCVIDCVLKMGSVLIRFVDDGSFEVVSRRALRKVGVR